MTKKDLIDFVKQNFYIDRDGELQYRWKEIPTATVKLGWITWLAEQGVKKA